MSKLEEVQKYVGSCIGWMSPDGEIVSCESWEHTDKAEEIADQLGYELEIVDQLGRVVKKKQPDDVLWKHGWIKIYMRSFIEHGLAFAIYRMASDPQKQKMREIYDRVPEWIAKGEGLTLKVQGVASQEELAEKGFEVL